MSDQLSIKTQNHDEFTILEVSGEIDMATAGMITDHFEALAQGDKTELVLDMTAVTFIDSTGIHALVEGKRLIYDRGSKIVLIPSEPVRRLFDLVFKGQRYAQRAESVQEAAAIINGRT